MFCLWPSISILIMIFTFSGTLFIKLNKKKTTTTNFSISD
jgi:hypothetical protein